MKQLGWMTRERTVAGRRAPSVLDWLVALALVIVAFLEAAGGVFPGPVAVAAAVQLAAILPVAFRRVAPLRAIAISAAVFLPYVVVYGAGNSLAKLLAGLLLIYSVGRHTDRRGLLAGAAFGLLLIAEELAGSGLLLSLGDWAYVLIVFGGALGLGVALRVQVQRSIALAVAAERARREQEATAQAAVHEERARIARELHDVVAHKVGLIVLQAGGARSVLATDPERARTALQQVEETGRQTLAEMRHLVGILRVDEGADRQPLPRLERLPALVDEARAAGLTVELEVEGPVVELPAGLELAAYRLIQEALTNVRKHAPTSRAQVRLCYEPDRLRIEVSDDGGPSGAVGDTALSASGLGHGLIGMRERVQLYDGRMQAGPMPGGGFRVEAVLPLSRRSLMTIDLIIVDDQALARAGLRMILEGQPDLRIVGEGSDGAEAVSLVRRLRPTVAILDVRMPRVDGLEATRRIVAAEPATRILILTTFDLDEYAFEALRAGASGFLLKDAPAEDIVHAVRTVARGDATLAPAVTRRLVEHYAARPRPEAFPALATLTARELEVLQLLAAGGSNAEIGDRLALSEATVKTHVGRVLDKLGVRDRVQAVIYAYESGLVEPGGPRQA